MNVLLPAFVLALLAQATDRSPWLAAILADRFGRWRVLAAALVALALGNAVAAAAAGLIASHMNAQGRTLMLALALAFAGIGACLPLRQPDRLDGWRIGGIATAFLGLAILALGDGAQFFVFALALGGSPVAIAVAATVGGLVALVTGIVLGEANWRALPLGLVRPAIGTLLLLAAAVALLSAFRIL